MDEQLEEELKVPEKSKTKNVINDEITSGTHHTYWLDSVEPQTEQKLSQGIATEVVIIGGGIAGLSVAYNLVKAGKK